MREEANSTGLAANYPAIKPAWAERRSGRISRRVPILLIGNDAEGTVFCEETHTAVLSLHGAGVVSRQLLVAEQELVLRIFGTNREAEIRVVGEIAEEGNLHTYGVAFLDKRLHFWGCSGCKQLEEVRNGEFEYDIWSRRPAAILRRMRIFDSVEAVERRKCGRCRKQRWQRTQRKEQQ